MHIPQKRRIVDYPDDEEDEEMQKPWKVGRLQETGKKKEMEDMDELEEEQVFLMDVDTIRVSKIQKGIFEKKIDCASSSSGATFPDHYGNAYRLLDMGFCQSDVDTALKACGTSTPIGTLISYITEQSQVPLAMEPTKLEQLERLGYAPERVKEAIKLCGEDAELDVVVDFLHAQEQQMSIARCSSSDEDVQRSMELLESFGYERQWLNEAINACGENADLSVLVEYMEVHQKQRKEVPKSTTLDVLVSFGYPRKYAKKAIQTCVTIDIDVLVDFMDAHTVKHEDAEDFVKGITHDDYKTYNRALSRSIYPKERIQREKKIVVTLDLSRGDMTGFGIHGGIPTRPRFLTPKQARLPYFYFENVSSMPAGTWQEIVRSLEDIHPEFVDAKYFSASRRPRGYVHNLPIENRFRLLPIPPQTIRELLPHTAPFTPPWDTRTKLSCINTVNTGAFVCRNIRKLLEKGELTDEDKGSIMRDVIKWNLVWTGPDTCATLEPHESEMALGFPKYHTRGAITKTQQARSIGNAFQVDTVGYHLSALKHRFPDGIRVLSLFAGIGGAEVALHRAGIHLKFVVSVEILEENRRILESWWMSSKQTGKHIILDDVSEVGLPRKKLKELIDMSGGFDLIIGGSPCNNLSGNNRQGGNNPSGRIGLLGQQSKFFFEFPRILREVREIMGV